MAQAIYCSNCQVFYTAEFRGRACPACGEELIHARFPAGSRPRRKVQPNAFRAVWDHIIKRDICALCQSARSTTIDHIQPKALGGSKGSWTNRAGTCRECNAAKAHTPLLFFMLEQRGLDISHLKDEDGNWPIPEKRDDKTLALTAAEEEAAKNSPRFDYRELLADQKPDMATEPSLEEAALAVMEARGCQGCDQCEYEPAFEGALVA